MSYLDDSQQQQNLIETNLCYFMWAIITFANQLSYQLLMDVVYIYIYIYIYIYLMEYYRLHIQIVRYLINISNPDHQTFRLKNIITLEIAKK